MFPYLTRLVCGHLPYISSQWGKGSFLAPMILSEGKGHLNLHRTVEVCDMCLCVGLGRRVM